MRISDTLTLSYQSLTHHKMRAFLTMLGIIIGVASVVTMVGIGQGAQDNVEKQIASLGTNVMILFPGATTQGGISGGAGSSTRLTEEDAIAIKDNCPAVEEVAPIARTVVQAVAGNANWQTAISGSYPSYFIIREWPLASGELYTDADARAGTKVCVLGTTVVQNLFGADDPIGQTIRVRGMPFRVIGVAASKGQNATGQDQDDVIFAPFGTVQKKLMGATNVNVMMIKARAGRITQAQAEITDLLRLRHRIQQGDPEDFTIRTQLEIATAAEQTTKTMTALLASIASISLLVGGIGIMNIMLVSVSERTKEIGIRKSIGARHIDIMLQFLFEALSLSIMGGIIGILLGIATGKIVASSQGWPVFISIQSIALAFGFAALTGIIFGVYPARKAALLSPIEALRYE